MKSLLFRLHQLFFMRRRFFRFNMMLFSLGLKGMGISNCDDSGRLSGERRFLEKTASLLDSPTVLDVGANRGEYSASVRSLMPAAAIVAFEPHPATFKSLQLAAAQHNFTAHNAACGVAPGQMKLFDYANGQGSQHASLYREVLTDLHHSAEVSGYDVQVIALDEFAAQHNLARIHLLKIDTEGHELSVLQGARQLLQSRRIDLVHFEFNEMNAISHVLFKDFVDLMPGYEFYRLLPDGAVRMTRYTPLYWELFAYQNIVAVRSDLARAFEKTING